MTEPGTVNIASHLSEMARKHPYGHAVVFPEGRDKQGRVSYTLLTFSQLDRESDRIAHALESIGISRGVRTVLMVKPSLEFFALTFALFKVGAVPVLVDPGMGVKNLKTCLEEAQPKAFIGIAKAHIARILFGWGKGDLETLVTVGTRTFWGGYLLRDLCHRPLGAGYTIASTDPNETAAILFTSGSTGVPKGVVYTHRNFAAQVEKLKEIYGIAPGEVDLPTFPLFALFAPALGMTSIIPDMDFTRPAHVDPKKIIEAIENFGITNMFGSPALINRVGRYGEEHQIKLPTLKRVISAGAPVPASVLERFSQMLRPEAQIHTPYGATESLPVCSIGSHEILSETRRQTDAGKGVCVGRSVKGLKLDIIQISDAPIDNWSEQIKVSQGQVGEIVVQGPQVTRSYFNRNQSTELAKIPDPASGTFFHRMGDVGYRDEHDRVWFCGRKAHRVRTQGKTLFTIPCEGIFNTHPKVFRSALVGVGQPGRQKPVICIELETSAKGCSKAALKSELLELAAQYEVTQDIKDLLFHPSFPVDIRHNAKIFREKLALWAERKLK